MTCEQALEYLMRKMENDLNHLEENILTQHLAGCTHCAALAQELEEDQGELEKYFQAVPPIRADFTERVMAQIKKEEKRSFWGSPWLKAAGFLVTLGLITALALPMLPNKEPASPKNPISQIAKLEVAEQPVTPSEQSASQPEVVPKTVAQEKEPVSPPAIGQEQPEVPTVEKEEQAAQPIQIAQAPEVNSNRGMMMRTLVAKNVPTLAQQITALLPTDYVLAEERVDTGEDGQTKAINLAYTLEGENCLAISLAQENPEVGTGAIVQQLDNGLTLMVRSEKLSGEELEKIVDSLLTLPLTLR